MGGMMERRGRERDGEKLSERECRRCVDDVLARLRV